MVIVLMASRAGEPWPDGGLAVLSAVRSAFLPAALAAFLPSLFYVLRDPNKTAVPLLFLTIIVALTMVAAPALISRFPQLPGVPPEQGKERFYDAPSGRAFAAEVGENDVNVLHSPADTPRFAVTDEEIPATAGAAESEAPSIIRDINALGLLLYAPDGGIGPFLVAVALSISLAGLWFFARSTESLLVNLTLVLLALRGIVFLGNLVQDEVVAEIAAILSVGDFDTTYIAAATFGVLGLLLLGANAIRRPPSGVLGEGPSL